uniref:Thiamine-triphosphatase n=1 Tax=Pelusios castaneus TaxID=367368 RepID=A0A8C8VIS9_9SAUR
MERPTMPLGSIEVESKFVAGPDTEAKLAALGAAPASNSSFSDCYYDTPDLRLTLADHWLRLRQGAGWELKCPPMPRPVPGVSSHLLGTTFPELPAWGTVASNHIPGARSQELPATATMYQELTSPQAIVDRLCKVVGVAPLPSWDQVPAAVAGLDLKEFASFVTQRRSYRLAGGLRVDLDEANFDYTVAEVEALAETPEDVPAALEAVMQLRQALGLEGTAGVPGKMSVYLQRHRPSHYQALLRAGVLHDPSPTLNSTVSGLKTMAEGQATTAESGPTGTGEAQEVEIGLSTGERIGHGQDISKVALVNDPGP